MSSDNQKFEHIPFQVANQGPLAWQDYPRPKLEPRISTNTAAQASAGVQNVQM